MYTLTEISTKKENVSRHQSLGEYFSVIEREFSKEEFKKAYNSMYGKADDPIFDEQNIDENIYCLLVTEGGKEIIPLSKGNFYYVVTESGKTFKNLTFK